MLFRANVIVVEDDPLNRILAVDALDDGGFDSVDFARADDALAYAEASERAPAVLLTDISVPGDQDGIDLARQFGSRWPETLVVVTSGRFGTERPQDVPADAVFLAKPWRGRELLAAVRSALDSRHG